MRTIHLFALLLFFADQSWAQSGSVTSNHCIAAFSIWKPKDEQRFSTGYRQHLQWHRRSGDKWDWYGWYVISGINYGQFVDATFDHAWSDFDHPVDQGMAPTTICTRNHSPTIYWGSNCRKWRMPASQIPSVFARSSAG